MNIRSNTRFYAILAPILLSVVSFSQDINAAQSTISDLCEERFSGRGYINDGDGLAAEYIATKYAETGLKTINGSYLQPFSLNVNTFPKAELTIDDKVQKPGYDFLVAPNAGSSSGSFSVFYVSSRMLTSTKVAQKVKKALKKGYIPVICQYDHKNKAVASNVAEIRKCNESGTLIFLKESLTWSVAMNQSKGTEIWLVDSIFDRYAKNISIDIKANFIKDYESQNVVGYIEGTAFPDSFVIFCGHYDHLGKMGEATFYGANDNASGIAMLLDMANYFKLHPQKYSIAFIAFGAEEAGLVGSRHYVTHPMFPLQKIKFLFNMDLMGSGDKGATIVNGSVFKKEFESLVEINTKNDYLPKIKPRGKAANSDHYFFTEAGVPSFFIYLMGDYTHYHIPADNVTNLKLGPFYDKSFLLIRDFIIHLNRE